jgi:hypothetical protein
VSDEWYVLSVSLSPAANGSSSLMALANCTTDTRVPVVLTFSVTTVSRTNAMARAKSALVSDVDPSMRNAISIGDTHCG